MIVGKEIGFQDEYYKSIAKRVVETQLSGLSKNGGETVANTLGRQMRENDLFERGGAGYYWLKDPEKAVENIKVKVALQDYLS